MFSPKHFTQSAVGRFAFRTQPNTPHCGPTAASYPIVLEAGYEVAITFHPEALDERGFLLDNLWFASYFQGFAESLVSISCERLARLIAEDICREIGGRACHCDAVCVTLEPVEGVRVACVMSHREPESPSPAVSMTHTPGGLWL